MGQNTNFKHWKRNFLTLLPIKAVYLIPQLTIRESGVWMDEQAQNYAYALLLHVVDESKRVDSAVKCFFVARSDCATAAWDILCE
jgi:spore cortex formation protein SpoVR/YcgB (stage V sporulation)